MMRMCSSGKISAEGHCDIVMLLSPPRVFLPINDQQIGAPRRHEDLPPRLAASKPGHRWRDLFF